MGLTTAELRPVEPLLTKKVLAKAPRTQRLIADEVLPPNDVTGGADQFMIDDAKRTGRLSGKIFVENKTETLGVGKVDFSLGATDRRPAVEMLAMGTHSYECQERGVETPVPGRYEHESILPESMDVRAGRKVRSIIELDREYRVAQLLFNAVNWETSAIGDLPIGLSTAFNQDGAKPLSTIKYILEMVSDAAYGIGFENLKLVIGEAEVRPLLENEQIRRYVGNPTMGGAAAGGLDFLNRSQLAKVIAANLELKPENIHIGSARINMAAEGEAANVVRCWTGGLWVGVCGMDEIGLDANGNGIYVDAVAAMQTEYRPLSVGAYNRDDGRVHNVFADEWRGLSIVDSTLGFFLSGVIS